LQSGKDIQTVLQILRQGRFTFRQSRSPEFIFPALYRTQTACLLKLGGRVIACNSMRALTDGEAQWTILPDF
jgi:hypothetical protein